MTPTFDRSQTPLRDLQAAAQDSPDKPFLTVRGETTTYGGVWTAVNHVASGLTALGITPGDRVVQICPNRPEAVWAWFGAQLAGTIDAPISQQAPGAFLRFLMEDVAPSVVIGPVESVAKVHAAGAVGSVRLAVLIDADDDDAPLGPEVRHITIEGLMEIGRSAATHLEPPVAEQVGTIMYTSGTTGPSKGVMLSHGYMSALATVHTWIYEIERGAKVYCVQPLCHIDGRSAVVDTMSLRGHLVLGERFSASGFWYEIEAYDVDCFFYVGTMIHLLHKQPVRDSWSPSRRRLGIGSSTPALIMREVEDRFNVELVEAYGLTELGVVVAQHRGRTEPGHIGWELPWVEIQVADDHDEPVAEGEVGQLLARPRGPHLHMLGYWNRPESTVEAWRGLWFHTGDLVRRTPGGGHEYIGRMKDSIRRRGENISAWEVEEAAVRHPSVLEAAAIGVPSELGEEDVAVIVVLVGQATLDPAELRDFLAEDLPRFAVPRFIDIVESLPKTPSERISKGVVRERGLSAAVHDAERGLYSV